MPISINHIVDALASLGGEAHLKQITARVSQIAPKPLPADIGASVRGRIQECCSGSKSYKGIVDLFESVHGVSARRGFWRLRSDLLNPSNTDGIQDGAETLIESEEGRTTLRIHLRRERSRKLIEAFKASLKEFSCSACGFDFQKMYGALGAGYIEAHHTIPVATLTEYSKTNIKDLVPLCANCHRIVHRNELMSIQELKKYIYNK